MLCIFIIGISTIDIKQREKICFWIVAFFKALYRFFFSSLFLSLDWNFDNTLRHRWPSSRRSHLCLWEGLIKNPWPDFAFVVSLNRYWRAYAHGWIHVNSLKQVRSFLANADPAHSLLPRFPTKGLLLPSRPIFSPPG